MIRECAAVRGRPIGLALRAPTRILVGEESTASGRALARKYSGVLGKVSMAGIAPLRSLLVYPPLMRGIGQAWRDGTPRDASPAASRSADRGCA